MLNSVKFRTFLFSLTLLLGSMTLFAQNADISDTQLAQFADAYINVQMQSQEAQLEMISVIEKEGLDVERFSQIQEASMNPGQQANATPDEIEKHGKAIEKLEALQPQLEKKAIESIEATGITMDQYQSIAMAIQQDQGLQQKLQTILMERSGK